MDKSVEKMDGDRMKLESHFSSSNVFQWFQGALSSPKNPDPSLE